MTVATATRPLSPFDHERAMREYGRRAEARAYALGNRGSIRTGADGKLLPLSLAADHRVIDGAQTFDQPSTGTWSDRTDPID